MSKHRGYRELLNYLEYVNKIKLYSIINEDEKNKDIIAAEIRTIHNLYKFLESNIDNTEMEE
jgi:hypothetical protein